MPRSVLNSPSPFFAAIAAALFLPSLHTTAAVSVNGVSDETMYSDSVTFDVPDEAGFTINAELEGEALRLFRGAGGVHYPGLSGSSPALLHLKAGSLDVSHAVAIEAAPVWTDVGADINANTTWPAGSRVHITGDIAIASGATLTIGESQVTCPIHN